MFEAIERNAKKKFKEKLLFFFVKRYFNSVFAHKNDKKWFFWRFLGNKSLNSRFRLSFGNKSLNSRFRLSFCNKSLILQNKSLKIKAWKKSRLLRGPSKKPKKGQNKSLLFFYLFFYRSIAGRKKQHFLVHFLLEIEKKRLFHE